MLRVPGINQPMLLLAGLLAFAGSASAQIADVVLPDPRGDFRTLQIKGPRGANPQRFWLVLDRDPSGLWCRDPSWRPVVALRRGAVLEADLQDPKLPALLNRQGVPYLRVRVKPMDILRDNRIGEQGKEFSCAVRASANFLAPIHPDSLGGVLLRP
jgi:hypothetical protein